jgi:hypothetical protein
MSTMDAQLEFRVLELDVAETLRGERDAEALTTVLRTCLGSGDELHAFLMRHPVADDARGRAFCRRLQRALERADR